MKEFNGMVVNGGVLEKEMMVDNFVFDGDKDGVWVNNEWVYVLWCWVMCYDVVNLCVWSVFWVI